MLFYRNVMQNCFRYTLQLDLWIEIMMTYEDFPMPHTSEWKELWKLVVNLHYLLQLKVNGMLP